MMGPGLAVRRGDTKTKLITKTELGSVSRWRRKPRGGGGEIIAGAWRAAGPDTAAGGGLQSLRYTLLTSADAMAWIFGPKVHQKRLVENRVACLAILTLSPLSLGYCDYHPCTLAHCSGPTLSP